MVLKLAIAFVQCIDTMPGYILLLCFIQSNLFDSVTLPSLPKRHQILLEHPQGALMMLCSLALSQAGTHACTRMLTCTFLIPVLVLYRFLGHTTWPEQFKDYNVSTVSMQKAMVTMCLHSVCRKQWSHCIYSQYAKSDKCRASAQFFLSSQFKHPTHGMVLLKPRVSFPLRLT